MLSAGAARGFTVVELLVAATCSSLVMGALLTIGVRQQRFATDVTSMLDTRGRARDAVDVLAEELRAISARDSDLYSLTASAVEYRAPTGSSVVCTVDDARTTLVIPALRGGGDFALTSWVAAPLAGDSLFIYDPGADPAPDDDGWRRYALTANATRGGNCGAATGLSAGAGRAAAAWTLHIDRPLSPTTAVGAAIRFFRRARYALYRASDGQWYLGYSDCLASRATPCIAPQPVSGPYLAPAPAGGGLALAAFDSAGAVVTDLTRAARVDVIARSATRAALRMEGQPSLPHTDSLATSIALRR